MAMAQVEVTRRKVLRGRILEVLNDSMSPLLLQTVESALTQGDLAISSIMLPCVNFLLDRGYIAVIQAEEPGINPMRDAFVRITDKGQDVVEGTVKDASVILSR